MNEREALLDIARAMEKYYAALRKIAKINYCLCKKHGPENCPVCIAKECLLTTKE